MSNKTKFTVSEIAKAKISGKTSQTVRRELKSRNASMSTVGKTIYVDLSELIRIYQPSELDFNLLSGEVKNDNTSHETVEIKTTDNGKSESATNVSIQVLEERIKSKDQQIDMLKGQLEREAEIANGMKEALETSLETQNKTTLMLEHYKKDGGSDSVKIESLEKRITDHEKTAAEEKEKSETTLANNRDLKKALSVYKITAVIFVLMAIIAITLFTQSIELPM